MATATPRDEMKVGVMLVGPNKIEIRVGKGKSMPAVRDLMPGPVEPNIESTNFPHGMLELIE